MLRAFFAALLLGDAVFLALWTEVRWRARPVSVIAVALHLAAAGLALVLAAEAMQASDGSRVFAVTSVLAIFLPALVYFFVSTIWAVRAAMQALDPR